MGLRRRPRGLAVVVAVAAEGGIQAQQAFPSPIDGATKAGLESPAPGVTRASSSSISSSSSGKRESATTTELDGWTKANSSELLAVSPTPNRIQELPAGNQETLNMPTVDICIIHKTVNCKYFVCADLRCLSVFYPPYNVLTGL